jgi:hypothetical protein
MGRETSAAELFDRSLATLVQSWLYLASGSPDAEVIETDGTAIATFVHSPDREFLNNAVLTRGGGDLGATLDTIEHTYASHGVERYAVWVHESEAAVAREVQARGYRYDSSTRGSGTSTASTASSRTFPPSTRTSTSPAPTARTRRC